MNNSNDSNMESQKWANPDEATENWSEGFKRGKDGWNLQIEAMQRLVERERINTRFALMYIEKTKSIFFMLLFSMYYVVTFLAIGSEEEMRVMPVSLVLVVREPFTRGLHGLH